MLGIQTALPLISLSLKGMLSHQGKNHRFLRNLKNKGYHLELSLAVLCTILLGQLSNHVFVHYAQKVYGLRVKSIWFMNEKYMTF